MINGNRIEGRATSKHTIDKYYMEVRDRQAALALSRHFERRWPPQVAVLRKNPTVR